jgi:Skp family chaperone for outer membrane proteins
MKVILTVMILALSPSSNAQDEALMQDAITKPVLSLRCKELFKERADKIKVQQRLNALLQRNQDLITKSPKAKQSLHARLKSTQVKVKNELYMTNLQIETMEENIVRSGCPGLSL